MPPTIISLSFIRLQRPNALRSSLTASAFRSSTFLMVRVTKRGQRNVATIWARRSDLSAAMPLAHDGHHLWRHRVKPRRASPQHVLLRTSFCPHFLSSLARSGRPSSSNLSMSASRVPGWVPNTTRKSVRLCPMSQVKEGSAFRARFGPVILGAAFRGSPSQVDAFPGHRS